MVVLWNQSKKTKPLTILRQDKNPSDSSLKRKINSILEKFNSILADKIKQVLEEHKCDEDSLEQMVSALVDARNKIAHAIRILALMTM